MDNEIIFNQKSFKIARFLKEELFAFFRQNILSIKNKLTQPNNILNDLDVNQIFLKENQVSRLLSIKYEEFNNNYIVSLTIGEDSIINTIAGDFHYLKPTVFYLIFKNDFALIDKILYENYIISRNLNNIDILTSKFFHSFLECCVFVDSISLNNSIENLSTLGNIIRVQYNGDFSEKISLYGKDINQFYIRNIIGDKFHNIISLGISSFLPGTRFYWDISQNGRMNLKYKITRDVLYFILDNLQYLSSKLNFRYQITIDGYIRRNNDELDEDI